MPYRTTAPPPAPTSVPVCGPCRFFTEDGSCVAPVYQTELVQINIGRKLLTVRQLTCCTSPRPTSVLNRDGKCNERELPEPTTWVGRIARFFRAA